MSTPSNPWSTSNWNFSITLALPATMPYLTALRSLVLGLFLAGPATSAVLAADAAVVATAAAARNSRRSIGWFIVTNSLQNSVRLR